MGTKRISRITIAALLVAATTAAPAAGMPIDPLGSPSASGIPAPPPSSIAQSAADEYNAMRQAAAAEAGTKSTESATVSTAPAATGGGFDVPSAAIGAAAAGLVALLAAGALMRRPELRHRAVKAS